MWRADGWCDWRIDSDLGEGLIRHKLVPLFQDNGLDVGLAKDSAS